MLSEFDSLLRFIWVHRKLLEHDSHKWKSDEQIYVINPATSVKPNVRVSRVWGALGAHIGKPCVQARWLVS